MRKKLLLACTVVALSFCAACNSAEEIPDNGGNVLEENKDKEEVKPTATPKSEEPTKAPTATPKSEKPTSTPAPTPTNTPVPTPTSTPTPSPTPAPLFSYTEEGDGIWITGLLDNSVENLVIPEILEGKTVTGIAASAFANTKILGVEIPASVTTIQENVFLNCEKLQNIVIAEGNTVYTSKAADGTECNVVFRMEDGALMYGCSASVIPEGTITIESSAFRARGIENVVLPESVVTVKNTAFRDCPNLKKLVIEGDTTLEDYSFMGCLALEEIVANGNVTASDRAFGTNWRKDYAVKKLTVADSYGSLVRAVRDTITSLTLLEGVQLINSGIICPQLKEISIPASVALIQPGAFMCPNLEKITVAEGNEYYTTKTADGTECYGLWDKETGKLLLGCSSTVFAKEITSIASYAFCGNKFDELVIPDGIEIEYEGFYYHGPGEDNEMEIAKLIASYDAVRTIKTGIHKLILTLPEGTTSIENEAFAYRTTLGEVVLPEGLEMISDRMFYTCQSLKKVEIPSTVTQIGPGAFSGCSSLAEVVLPEGMTRIEGGTFTDCHALTSIQIPSSVTYIGYGAFYCCSGLTEVSIPASVTEICEEAFYGCTNLVYIVAPADSYAAAWAKENGYRVKSPE